MWRWRKQPCNGGWHQRISYAGENGIMAAWQWQRNHVAMAAPQ